MTVPFRSEGPVTDPPRRPWSSLDAVEKRERALAVAGELFARDGLDVPMPVLADAIGVGVGSIYRQIGRKEDIVVALLVARIRTITEHLERAGAADDPWTALCEATYAVVAHARRDHVTQEAWAASSEHPDVLAVRARAAAALDGLVAAARAHGALRQDAEADDLRLVFRAVKDVEDLSAGGARRLATLALRGIAADGRSPQPPEGSGPRGSGPRTGAGGVRPRPD